MITLKDDNKIFDGHGGSCADAPKIYADWVLLSDFQMICRIFLQRNDSDSREIVKHSFILHYLVLASIKEVAITLYDLMHIINSEDLFLHQI